jgi:hypothetical protein
MRIDKNRLQLRQTGKGFIFLNTDGIAGRRLTETFVDQSKKTYVKINGEITPLTAEHNFLSIDR